MSYMGRQFNVASKRRKGGKVETNSDLVSRFESVDFEEVVIAVVRCERNQEQQCAGQERCPALAIRQPGWRRQNRRR
jgi:hypothetical protein